MSFIHVALRTAVGFVRENAPESSTRLVMILFAVTASGLAIATMRFAFLHSDATAMVIALGGIDTLFIGGGAVAIALRMRKGGEPGDSAASAPGGVT